MACTNNSKFRIKADLKDGQPVYITATNESKIDVCTATKIVDRLHKEFTEKYVTAAATGKTVISNTQKNNPTFFLRKQPKLSEFNGEATADGTEVDRFYSLFTTKDKTDPVYRGAVSAIMKGEYDENEDTYLKYPESIRTQTNFENPNNFKGVYGLVKVNEILEKKIAKTVSDLRGSDTSSVMDDAKHYEKRQEIKKTFEEIANQENRIYREKFLSIILVVVGIFIVSSQLMKDYFSFSGGGGGIGSSGSGFGGVGGWLSTRFGSGSGGIFSRFGGIGLGSSGRSRVGNLFTSSPYTTSQRE
jgi:hypothetical protein